MNSFILYTFLLLIDYFRLVLFTMGHIDPFLDYILNSLVYLVSKLSVEVKSVVALSK